MNDVKDEAILKMLSPQILLLSLWYDFYFRNDAKESPAVHHASVAVPPAPVRIPSQWSLSPSVTLVKPVS